MVLSIKTLEPGRIFVVDAAGRVRVAITEENGQPGIIVYGAEGEPAAAVAFSDDEVPSPVISVIGRDGQPRAVVLAVDGGEPLIANCRGGRPVHIRQLADPPPNLGDLAGGPN